jgi:hypothetical protein
MITLPFISESIVGGFAEAQLAANAEFAAAVEAGKYMLYVQSILDQLGLPQNIATTLYEDNQGALLMANQQQLTTCT